LERKPHPLVLLTLERSTEGNDALLALGGPGFAGADPAAERRKIDGFALPVILILTLTLALVLVPVLVLVLMLYRVFVTTLTARVDTPAR